MRGYIAHAHVQHAQTSHIESQPSPRNIGGAWPDISAISAGVFKIDGVLVHASSSVWVSGWQREFLDAMRQ